MRFIYFLFLIAFLAAVGIFAYQNQQSANLEFLNWSITQPMALVIGAVYVLGMFSGWTIVGMLKRSFERVTDDQEGRR
jgi:uncharacterized integral membrane protein